MRIRLAFKELVDLDLLGKGPPLRLIRVLANVRFQTAAGWTSALSAIVDTGSPISIIPSKVWQVCRVDRFAKTEIRGVIPGADAVVPAVYGRLACSLLDAQHASEPLKIRAFLAETAEVPAILGIADILERASLWVDYQRQQAWLEL